MKYKAILALFFVLLISGVAFADLNDEAVAKVKEPIENVTTLITSVASAIAVLVFIIAGIMFLTSGANFQARDNAKNMMIYAAIGLAIIMVAPYLVQLLFTT